jgi:glycosyltransferase involved in cell wall biosynthesis
MLETATNRPAPERSISVVVPVLNEGHNVEGTVAELVAALEPTVPDYEIVIVDDGSTDDTGARADRLAAENPRVRAVHNARNMGIGYSYARGYQAASKAYAVYIPGDNTWPRASCEKLFGGLGKADVIVSYAANPEIRPLGRRLVSALYTRTVNLLFRRRMPYYNGLNIFPAPFLRGLPPMAHGFGFQAEVLLRALAAGMSHVQIAVPISERAVGKSKAVTVRNIAGVAVTVLRLLWELRIASLFGRSPSSARRA